MFNFVKSKTILKVFKDFNSIKEIPNPVLTIGTFDGVHIGHQKIIDQLNEEAAKIGGESVLFTFFPHPRMILFPESHGLKLIQTQKEKLEKLERMGLQNIIVFPFTFEFSRLSALEFVRDILVNQLQVKKLVIGYDHQFGKNREGTIDFLKDISETYKFTVVEIPPQLINNVNVSSTKIREAIVNGDVELANGFLGEPFQLSGEVVRGNALGRTIGYPTANIKVDSELKLIPGNGVYAVKVKVKEQWLNGMLNIGVRPTLTQTNAITIEVNIFDFAEDIYGEYLTVQFLSKWRDEKKFDGITELKEQLKKDEETIRNMLTVTL
jgi:riboflavin kinase/FMN adenylyltransferase